MKSKLFVAAIGALGMCSVCAAGDVLSGGGTESDPYAISSRSDFDAFCEDSSYWEAGVYTRLDVDLDLSDKIYSNAPIAPDSSEFCGVFDGNSHVIRNLNIDGTESSRSYLGLFGTVSGESSAVKNLSIMSGSISGGDNLGGLCGLNYGGTIELCYAGVDISGDNILGGLCGYNLQGTLTRSYASGTVSSDNDGYSLGGLCGETSGTISNCYAVGAVVGSSGASDLGSLCGFANSGEIRKCYAIGSVTTGEATQSEDTLYGYKRSNCTISDCFSGTGEEMQLLSTYTDAGWDFVDETENGTADIWVMADYPVLTGFYVKWIVESAHGTPVPAVGTNMVTAGTTISNFVEAAVLDGVSTQYVCTGWNDSGETNAFAAEALEDTVITWNWSTNYWLEVTVEGEGTAAVGETPWYAPAQTGAFEAAGSSVSITASASSGYRFDHWELNGAVVDGGDSLITVTMDAAQYAEAVFVELTLAEVVDCDSLNWSTGGAAEWGALVGDTSDGEDAACSGSVEGNSTNSWIKTSVYGSGTLSFYWKVSSEADYDWLRFTVDDEIYRAISGEQDWVQVELTITESGSHTLCWEYVKDKSMLSGSDCGMLDQVVWTPDYSNGFYSWADELGLEGDYETLFSDDRDDDGVENAFEYAFGTNLLSGEVMLDVIEVNGTVIAEIPVCEDDVLDFVEITLLSSTNMIDWTVPVVLSSETDGKPDDREWYESEAECDAAYFKLQAELK